MKQGRLSPTLEDYLEAIFHIVSTNMVARSMEIAERLNVKRSSVTVALRTLAEKGFINYQARSYVTLTDRGLNVARCVDRRHHVLFEMFNDVLGLSEPVADQAACSMEHGMSSEVCKSMTAFLMAMKQDSDHALPIKKLTKTLADNIDCSSDCGYAPSRAAAAPAGKDVATLNILDPQESGTIIQINGTGTLKKRLQELGITRGERITVVRIAPLGDPIEVKVKGFRLSLRREEADTILIQPDK
ncbi:MAG: DtxR family transcriptional regulator [Chitinispirillaceae bacterium]|nr:DtxR family transcriptional regulator [Chitinispirillaceae bacterium]